MPVYTDASCAAITPGTVANADGSGCVITEDEAAAWYADPQFWVAMRAQDTTPDPLSMIMALVLAGQTPGAIDPAATLPLCPEGFYTLAPATPGGPPQCVQIPNGNGDLPSWALPAGVALLAVLLLRR